MNERNRMMQNVSRILIGDCCQFNMGRSSWKAWAVQNDIQKSPEWFKTTHLANQPKPSNSESFSSDFDWIGFGSLVSCFESFWWFLNVILDCSGFSAAPAHIKLAAIIIIIQTLWLFSSRREPPFVVYILYIFISSIVTTSLLERILLIINLMPGREWSMRRLKKKNSLAVHSTLTLRL